MKKISLIVAALAACSMGLVSCGGGDNPNPGPDPVVVDGVTSVTVTGAPAVLEVGKTAQLGANVVVTGNAAKTVTWSVDKTGLASIDANGLLTAKAEGTIVVTARSTVDPTVKGTATISLFVDPQIKKVTISGAPAQMLVGEKATLSATVEVVGGASRAVRWTSDKPAVISVNSSGAIEANAAGTATITATAADDSTVFDSVTIIVIEPNWSDDLLDEMTEKLGEPIPYFAEFEETLAWYDDEEIFYGESDDSNYSKALSILSRAGYDVTETTYSFWGIIELPMVYAVKELDSAKIVVEYVDWSELEMGSELYASSIPALTEWPEELVDEYTPAYMDFEKEHVPEVEADKYYVSAGDELIIEISGAKVTLDEYLADLADANWEIYDDEQIVAEYGGIVCASENGTIQMIIAGEGNNFDLEIYGTIPMLDAFPADYVNAFVSEQLGSIFTVPELDFQDIYYYMEGVDEDESPLALVNIDYAEETTEAAVDKMVSDYKDALDALGYETQLTPRVPETETSYGEGPALYAQKGKIVLQLSESLQYLYEYDLYIGLNPYAEESAISVEDDLYFILATETPKIEVTVDPEFEGKGDLSFTSKNEAVATVDNEGNITAVAEGQAKIEVAYTVSAEEVYKLEVEVNVVPAATGIEIDAEEEMNSNETQYLSVFFTPEGSKYETESDVVYAITEGFEYASIVEGELIPNQDVIEEDVTIKVTATLDSFVSEPFEITIKYVEPSITEEVSFKNLSSANANLKDLTIKSASGVSFVFSKGTGLNEPIYHSKSNCARIYNGNTFTVTAPEGHTLTNLVFNETSYSDSKNGRASVTPSTGSMSGSVWTGEAESVTFTIGDSGQFRFDKVTVTLDGEPTPVEESETLKTLKSLITPVAADLFNKSSSEVTFLDYDLEGEADVYYHDEASLTFVDIYFTGDVTGTEGIAILEEYLPGNAVLDEELSEDYPDEDYYDRWYDCGDFYYVLWASGDGESEADLSFDIVPADQLEDYYDYCYSYIE